MEANPKFRGRATAAFWSKSILAVAAVLSVLILPFSFDLESAAIVVGILAVTYFEFRVHRYFSDGDARGPSLGFRNQSCFAAGILVYGLYHASVPMTIPAEYSGMLDEPTLEQIQTAVRYAYLAIGLVGGISQFALACYYRGAKAVPSVQVGD
jgi:hypothetical protein